jgi:phage-related protein
MPDNEIKLKLVIDGKEALASISLTDKELKELASSIRNAGEESRSSGDKLVHAFAQARNLIQGLKETFSLLSQALQSNITAYQEQESALIKLTTALQITNQYTNENVKALTDYAAQLQQLTIYGDEVTETVMAQLLQWYYLLSKQNSPHFRNLISQQ